MQYSSIYKFHLNMSFTKIGRPRVSLNGWCSLILGLPFSWIWRYS